MKQLQNRLKRIEASTSTEYAEVLQWIAQGLYYDELTDEQKDLYCRYKNTDRQTVEEINLLFYSADPDTALHFRLEKNLPPMSPEQEREHIRQAAEEIQAYLNQP